MYRAGLLLVLGLVFFPALIYAEIDKDKCYLGDPEDFVKPAEVDSQKVFAVIPAYKEILEKGLDPSDARYHILMAEASEVFNVALVKCSEKYGYDLIGEKGAISEKGKKVKNSKGEEVSVADITKEMIKEIEGEE